MTIRERIAIWQPRISAVAAEIFAVLARVTLGQAFIIAGLGKLQHIDNTTTFFASLGIPLPGIHAVGIGCLELVGGALLVLGLAVRPVACLLLATMAVAILTAHRADFVAALALYPDKGLTEVVPWMFGLILCGLVAHGAGRLSLDRLVWRRCCEPATKPG